MTRNRDEFDERNAERAFAELGDGIEAPSPDDLRALARTASAAPRTPTSAARRLRPPSHVRWTVAAATVALLVGSALGFGLGSIERTRLPAEEFAAFVSAGNAVAAPAAVTTRSCAPAGPFLNVHIIGNKDASFWAQSFLHPELFAGIPPKESFVSVWTFGNQSGGPALYGWIADGSSRFAMRCRARTARAPTRGNLRPVLRVKDGWAFGGRFECDHRGRFVIQTEQLGRRMRMAVWIARSGELLALAEVGPRGAWARVAERCSKRSG